MMRILIFTAGFIFAVAINTFGADTKESVDSILKASGITSRDIAAAEGKKDLTLFNVISLAVKNNNILMIKREDINSAEARRDQAFGTFLPKVLVRGAMVYPEINKYTTIVPGASLVVRQPIITGLDEISAFRGAKAEIKMRNYEMRSNINLLLNDVSYNFFRVSSMDTDLKSMKQVLVLYNNVLRELQRRVALGRSRTSEVLRINTEIYNLQSQITANENDLASAFITLSSLTGIPAGTELVFGHALKDAVNPEKKINDLIEDRWDVKSAREAVLVADARLLAAKGQHLPSLYLEGAYRLYRKDKMQKDYYGSIGVDIPIFSGGITSAKVREMEAVRTQAGLLLSETLRNARRNIIDFYQTWVNSKQEVEAYKMSFNSAERNYYVVMNEYRLNLVTIIDVFNALTTLQKSKQDYERALYRYSYYRVRLGIETNEITGDNIGILRASMPDGAAKTK